MDAQHDVQHHHALNDSIVSNITSVYLTPLLLSPHTFGFLIVSFL